MVLLRFTGIFAILTENEGLECPRLTVLRITQSAYLTEVLT